MDVVNSMSMLYEKQQTYHNATSKIKRIKIEEQKSKSIYFDIGEDAHLKTVKHRNKHNSYKNGNMRKKTNLTDTQVIFMNWEKLLLG